jgi:hypothetical protein
MKKLFLIILLFVIVFESCTSIKEGCPSNVAAWEKRVKFNK